MRKTLAVAVIATLLAALATTTAGAGTGVLGRKNLEWVPNRPQAAASDIEFLERKQADGSLKRYAIVGVMGHGFSIIDITNPDLPLTVGRYVSPGFQWQGDVQVNPKRNIVVLSTDGLGASLAHGTSCLPTNCIGIELVDITDLSNPTRLGVVSDVGGAHNATIIDDRYIYTALPTHIIDYSDPRNPKNLGAVGAICGHDLTVDKNNPDRLYSACSSGNKWQIVDISKPAEPVVVTEVKDTKISIAHQADPAPDSSFVIVSDERGGGLSNSTAPGGGAHIYDISGKYVDGASEVTPKKMGFWVPPFGGVSAAGGFGSTQTPGTWGNVTMHNFTFQPERLLVSVGWYSMGTWVFDPSAAPVAVGQNSDYPAGEWNGTQNANGPTTWSNTRGHFLTEGAETWSSKWTSFDDPKFDRYIFTSDITRGFDAFRYTGPLPKKIARLRLDAAATGGVITGKLDRYAVLTHEGWVNKPLEGQTVEVKVNDQTFSATTAAEGTFSVTTGLGAGTYDASATWAGDEVYEAATATASVTVS